jgi:hypothetical protein
LYGTKYTALLSADALSVQDGARKVNSVDESNLNSHAEMRDTVFVATRLRVATKSSGFARSLRQSFLSAAVQ